MALLIGDDNAQDRTCPPTLRAAILHCRYAKINAGRKPIADTVLIAAPKASSQSILQGNVIVQEERKVLIQSGEEILHNG